ncbi:Xyloglucan galactosyltransferase katamari1-like protein, partial [Thalictrum thalictroides]
MEKLNGGGVRPSIFRCVVFALFIFSFFIIYTNFAQFVMPIETVVQSSTKEYVYSTIETPLHPSSLFGSDNHVVERISPSSVGNNGEEDDRGRNISFPTNSEKSVSGFLVDEQQTENGDEYVDMDIDTGKKIEPVSDPCLGKYVYVHNIPSKFNTDLLKDCRSLCHWSDMCLSLSNEGLGPSIDNSQGVFLNKGWFATDQFALEVIFHNRMKQYKCQTNNSSLASAIYVPFYAGLDISRYLWGGFNTSIRDSTSHELLRWLTSRPEWQGLGGRDHFLVGGRIAWDFRRMTDKNSNWGNNLLVMPELKNMSMLLIESSPYHSNEVAIPYPTYFHPSTDDDVLQWQEKMRRQKKRHLFSFAGAPRPQSLKSIRGCIIQQCQASSSKCKLLECRKSSKNVCHDPSSVMKLFQDSVFCLQPPGDSFTR